MTGVQTCALPISGETDYLNRFLPKSESKPISMFENKNYTSTPTTTQPKLVTIADRYGATVEGIKLTDKFKNIAVKEQEIGRAHV